MLSTPLIEFANSSNSLNTRVSIWTDALLGWKVSELDQKSGYQIRMDVHQIAAILLAFLPKMDGMALLFGAEWMLKLCNTGA